jgi:RNA polymerase sigma-70 factor (ECF subfamily)
MNEELAGLLERISRGDFDALGCAYDLMADKIYNYMVSITQSKQISEDITHDIFLLIVKYAGRIQKASNPCGYIMTMAKNQAYSRLKREKRTILVVEIPDIAVEANHENLLDFHDAFKLLPANQREVIYLHLICGFTQKETAKIQQAPLVTVKWRYSKALATLQKEMKE